MIKDNWERVDNEIGWMDDAACKEHGVHLFFPDVGENPKIKKAQKLCLTCPVKVRCLTYGMLNNEAGIWGGTTGRERRLLRQGKIGMQDLSINSGGFKFGRPKKTEGDEL